MKNFEDLFHAKVSKKIKDKKVLEERLGSVNNESMEAKKESDICFFRELDSYINTIDAYIMKESL